MIGNDELKRIARQFDAGEPVSGWHRYFSTYRKINAYYNKKLGLVIKRPHCILEENTPTELRIPTTELGGGWVAQPIANKIKLKSAVNAIRKKLKKYPDIYPDVHVGNVGWYKGKPILFDW